MPHAISVLIASRSIEDWKNMVFNRFSLLILLRVGFLMLSVTALASIFLRPDLLFTQIILSTAIIGQVVELSYYVNKTNYELNRFLASIRDGDFAVNFTRSGHSHSFRALNSTFTEIAQTLKSLETEKVAQLHFLNQLVDQIEFGIVTFDNEGNIRLMNEQASMLLAIPRVTVWKNLKSANAQLLQQFLEIGDVRNRLIEYKIDNENRFFSVSVTTIRIMEESYKIVSFQDIRSEIEQKEIEAWHKLIRILTHEIMNSVTPLVSLTETIGMIMKQNGHPKKPAELDSENIHDVVHAVDTIKDRCEGILKFVQDYRKLTRIPKPELEVVNCATLIEDTLTLFGGEISKSKIKLATQVTDSQINVDVNLIQQVLINLIKNAIEALRGIEQPKIQITVLEANDAIEISVQDNGSGIPENKLTKIFIPFYTTKEDGSGIGLSLSRQIMSLHGGQLTVRCRDTETRFTLSFPVQTTSSTPSLPSGTGKI